MTNLEREQLLLRVPEKSSAEMTDACSKLLPDFFDKPFCQLICWFASPKDRGTPGSLSELFGHSVTDPTDICLLHCLANLVACAIGTQEQARRSHLWYLVFAPEKLEGTYFPGCMNDGLVNAKRGKPYEEGVQLSKDGLNCFLQQSITSSVNLNSRCLLLWINVASFCVSLLVQEGERLSGILSGKVPVDKYCVSQLRHIWKFMRNNMQLTDEELSYFVMMCMRRYLQTWVASSDKVNGIFTSAGMVAQYEQLWHSDVFVPCLENLETEFMKNLKYPLKKLLVEIRQLEAHYPNFPEDTAALYSVLSLPDLQTQSQDKLVVLSKFICRLPDIQISLPFLPDFIEFYQWLHKDLAGVLTPEKADKLSIKKLVDQMSRHYSGESGRKLRSLYQRVKCGYNCYMKDATGVTADGGFDKISVRHFLTLDASTLPGNSEGDILYSIIYYMATCHNELLDCVQTVASYSTETHMNRYIPEGIPSVAPTDFAEGACVVEKSGREKLQSDFLQLVSRRHHFSTAAWNWSQQVVTNPHYLVLEDLLKLQEDVVSLYLSGRPKIKNIVSLHIPYAFQASKPAPEADPLNFEQDLNQVGKCLPPILKNNLTEDHHVLQLLECEFHSVDYHTMLDVVTGLKTAITLLEKRVKETGSDGTDIHKLTLEAFLCSEEDKHQALEIFGKRLSEHQMSTVMYLPVSNLYHTFTTFIQWVVEGRYNFYMLPYILKAHLDPENIEKLKKIQSLYKKGCEPKELLMEFKLLAEVLDFLESNLMTVGTQIPLVDYLTSMVIFEGHDEFLGLIPKTILIQHYVSLRILLKHLTAEIQKDLPKDKEEQDRRWLELVPCFSGEIYEAQPETIQAGYGFKHGYSSDTESIKIETCSSVTQFDLLHEDDLDEFPCLHTSDLKSLTGATSLSVKESPVTQMSVDASQNFPVATSTEEKTENHSASSLSHEMPVDTLQQVHLLMESETKPEGDNHCAKTLVHETSMDSLQEAHLLMSTEAKPETSEKQLLKLARQYTSEAMANFVTSIGYPDYAELFEDNDYSGDVVVECGDEDLKDLGIESALARLKIIILFQRQLQGLHSVAKNFPADKVVEFLDELKSREKEQYKQNFSSNEIDGEMLLAMKENYDVMSELGVKRAHSRMIWTRFQTLLDSQGYST